jgi:hypothetical protein
VNDAPILSATQRIVQPERTFVPDGNAPGAGGQEFPKCRVAGLPRFGWKGNTEMEQSTQFGRLLRAVILSAAKNLISRRPDEILRFAQNDND